MIVGIDPGFTGAWAALSGTGEGHAADLRVLGSGKSRYLDSRRLFDELSELALIERVDRVVVEHVHASPQMGVASAFNFGATFGSIRAVINCLGWRADYVTPAVWKRALRVPTAKNEARRRATELLPGMAWNWPRAKDDGRAEAALIALYGKEHL